MKAGALREGAAAGLPCGTGSEEEPVDRTEAITEALRAVADPCCEERGINVVDMGLVAEVVVDGDRARVDLLLTSGWCPFQVDLLANVAAAVEAVEDVRSAEVRIVLDEVWSTDRMAPGARAKLRFLPEPGEVGDPRAYVAARLPVLVQPAAPRPAAPSPTTGAQR
jgi:metal-sulfur cluster biosynthetic enzyme